MSKEATSLDSVQVLIDRLERLRDDLAKNPTEWENITLAAYLEAVQSCLEDNKDRNQSSPTWADVAEIFEVGKIYE